MPVAARLPILLVLLLVAGAGTASLAAGEEAAEARPGVPDAALQEAINQAIDKGAKWLRTEQAMNGAFGGVSKDGATHHQIGTAALVGLALLAAGDQRGDAVVDKIHAYLKKKDELHGGAGSRSTYDTGILIMFLTAYWRGPEIEDRGRGHTSTGARQKNPCNLPPEAQRWVQDLANWLVRARKAATSTWGYPAHRDDHSNTQYAFLGLRAARDCGAKVPSPVFVQAAKTMLDRQEQDGPKVPRILPSPDPDASPYVIDAGDRARGWSYMQEPFTPTGSMTTSGIAILAICHDALTQPKVSPMYDSKLQRRVSQGIQDGFSWLDKHWDITRNPGPGAPNWHFYYLYGLERAAVFGGRDLVGRNDWYLEGARYLVGKQLAEGRWHTGALGGGTFEASDVIDTAWAILFLARATRPMPPILAPVVTPSD